LPLWNDNLVFGRGMMDIIPQVSIGWWAEDDDQHIADTFYFDHSGNVCLAKKNHTLLTCRLERRCNMSCSWRTLASS
jgi:hypothetical protein